MGRYMDELEIRFNMVKPNGEDFTDDEIDKFTDEFIDLVEKHGYLVGGGIGPYNEHNDSDDFNEDEEVFSMGEEDIELSHLDPDLKGPWQDELG